MSVRARLAIAQHALRLSQRQLGARLRALYMSEDADPIAVILGASSLDEMMTGLDGIARAAEQNRSVIVQTRSARSRLARTQRALAAKQAELASLERPRRRPPPRSSGPVPSASPTSTRSPCSRV